METETVFSFKHPNFKQILEQILYVSADLYVCVTVSVNLYVHTNR